MSEPAADLKLRDEELAVRTARKDGRQVVSLRSIARAAGDFVVECEVYPVSGLRVEPLTPGPYTFATSHEASYFIDEALEALTYLGCEVS
jgi:hypothetical protein